MDEMYSHVAALDPTMIMFCTRVVTVATTSWVGLLGLALFTCCSSLQLTISIVATASFTYGCGTFVWTMNRLLNLEFQNPAIPALFILFAMLLTIAATRRWNEDTP